MESKNLFVRELVAEDIKESYLDWFKNDEVTKFLEVDGHALTVQDVIRYFEHGRATKTYFMYAICLKETGKHIGNLKVGPIDWKHGLSDLVTVIGDREQWGKGYATEAIKLGNRLAFEKYNIRKLTGGMYASNIGSTKAYTNAGWIIEGRLFNHYVVEGKFEDRIIVSCFNPHFEQ
ncbi:MAG: GNAT family N-acetyltransferase [Bacteroidetes bacterium]|nr:MAG: GNAT family N-acetyltransferase [Bacteroidota bacterium]